MLRLGQMTFARLAQSAAFCSLLLAAPLARATASAEFYRSEALGYGRFEARMRLAPGVGIVSSFFLWKDGSEVDGTYWNELDFEKIEDCVLQTNSIYGLPEVGHEQLHGAEVTSLDLCGAYHTYAFEWLPESITWSIDGTVIRTDSGADAQAYADNAATSGLQMRFNVWPGDATFGGEFSEAVLPVQQYIAWARHSAHTPGAGPDGSDFTLTFEEQFDAAPSGWAFGTWDSPLGHSLHTADNVTFSSGTAVLSLTTDAMTGFSGTVPADAPGSGGAGSGGASSGGAGSGGDAAGGSSSGGASSGGASSGGASSGGSGSGGTPMFGGTVPGPDCGCSLPGRERSTPWVLGAPLLLVAAWLLRRGAKGPRLSSRPPR